ncbi:MFS transporter [Rhizocola hellebori]|uniref:MFS transporter n=1 Tax=Rhizocola hellebori TaxID=1392758 RepID=A0A8J3VHS4_9ACTN|nr:MFS transporter [Rhizocola hellebori]
MFALGTVSLITDVSAEMVTAILPVYLVVGLSLSPAAYGLIDGVYSGATVLLRLAGGYAADRISGRKSVAGAGYAMSALAKLGLLAAGASVPALAAAITADRAGKGLRTAPRDALITLSTPPTGLGRAFGVHRTMDTIGAFAGPLVALGILMLAGAQRYDAVFVASFCIAAFGVVVLVLFVRDDRASLLSPSRPVSPRLALGLLRRAPIRRLLAVACLFGLSTIGDGFVYLLLQRREGLNLGWFPLLAVGTSLGYLVLAYPMGSLADRLGRRPVLLIGLLSLLSVYLVLLSPMRGVAIVVAVLACLGLFYAATDGVLMALAGPLLPESLRATGLALVQSSQALAYFVSSILFGLAWSYGSQRLALAAAALTTLAALILTRILTRLPVAIPEASNES